MEMINSASLKKLFGTKQHRAVAPIIATLLMVAIAVVGGVLIYVYTQGFFASTQSTTVSTDVLTMTGYDGTAGNTLYTGGATAVAADSTPTAGKLEGEPIAIHIRNAGGGTVAISALKIDGLRANHTASAPSAGGWGLYGSGGMVAALEPNIASGDEATLVYRAGTGGIAIGSTVTVEVLTASGSSFTFKVIEGQRK